MKATVTGIKDKFFRYLILSISLILKYIIVLLIKKLIVYLYLQCKLIQIKKVAILYSQLLPSRLFFQFHQDFDYIYAYDSKSIILIISCIFRFFYNHWLATINN